MAAKMILPIGNNPRKSLKSCRFKASEKGFVLLELIIVVLIVGIFSLLTLPGFRKFSREISLERTCRNLSQTIRFTHFRSVSEEKNYRICFDLKEKSFWLEKKSNGEEDFEKFSSSLIKKRKLNQDIQFARIITPRGEEISPGEAHLNFFPDGSSENCLIYLKNKNDKLNTILVKAPTSRVITYDYIEE